MSDPGDARQQAAGWDADSLREVRARAEAADRIVAAARVVHYEYFGANPTYPEEIELRDALSNLPKGSSLTESVGLLLGRVQEADESRDFWKQRYADLFTASRLRVQEAERALREIADYKHPGSFRVEHYDELKRIARAALGDDSESRPSGGNPNV